MSAKTCTFEGCEASVRVRPATEMPTLVNTGSGTKTIFDVRYCDAGHILRYQDRQVELPEGEKL